MSAHEQVLADLIHDLAQPLSAIETGAFCLEFHVDPQNVRAFEYLRAIQQQVERADSILAAAAAEIRHSREVHEPLALAAVSH